MQSRAGLIARVRMSLQARRVANASWNQGCKVLALALQSRVSEVTFLLWVHSCRNRGEDISGSRNKLGYKRNCCHWT
ncbi:putative serine O-acetyltransferase [Helianthus anomalus]